MDNEIKIIHYCWFGPKPLSKLAKKCMKSWKKFLPDYEVKLWNEENFDYNQNVFVRQAYEQKKWAFVADYARFKALSEYGGIYLDTDIEIVKNVSEILRNECFVGIEDSKLVNAAVIGAKAPHNRYVDEMVAFYDSQESFNSQNDLYKIMITAVQTNKLIEYGLDRESNQIQVFMDGALTVYPREYFYPLSYDYQDNKFTENTCMIHHYDATWASTPEKTKLFFRRHNMKFMVWVVDKCVSVKIRTKRIMNRIKGRKNE